MNPTKKNTPVAGASSRSHPARGEDAGSRLAELEMVCRLWMAASEAKDERIEELENELVRLRRRVTRLGRMLGSGQGRRRKVRVSNAR